jgi:S-adenosylmethionine synthetase
MDHLVVSAIKPTDEPVEVVERKGLGHPDTMATRSPRRSRALSALNTVAASARS